MASGVEPSTHSVLKMAVLPQVVLELVNCHHEELPSFQTFSNYQLNAQFLYSSTICMFHYDPQHVSSSTLLILSRKNIITTASGIVILCKQPYSMPVESGLSSLSTGIL